MATTGQAATPKRTDLLRIAARWQLAARSPHDFLRWFVITNKHEGRTNVDRPFPWSRPHLYALTNLWLTERRLAVLKYRQAMATWWASALLVWDALFHDGRLLMAQAKRLQDVVGDPVTGDGLLGRGNYIVARIPYKNHLGVEVVNWETRGRGPADRIMFPRRHSTIWGIPQGGTVINQRTPAGVASDEAGLQEEFAEAVTNALPCIRAGGWFLCIGTAHQRDGGEFKRIALDLPDPTAPEDATPQPQTEPEVILPGMLLRHTRRGFAAVHLLPEADPIGLPAEVLDDQHRELGSVPVIDKAVTTARAGIVGLVGWNPSWKFRQQYLGDFEAQEGVPVFSFIDTQKAHARNPIGRMDLDESGKLVERAQGRLLVFLRPDTQPRDLPAGAVSVTRACGIGMDVSEGVGASDSTIEVFFADSLDQAAELADNHISPADLGRFAAAVGRYYNDALICCMRKLHGITTLRAIVDEAKYPFVWHHRLRTQRFEKRTANLGWAGGESSDESLMNPWIDALQHGRVTLHGLACILQHEQYIYDEMGRMTLQERASLPIELRRRHGDRVIGCAAALVACKDVPVFKAVVERPKEFWELEVERRQRESKSPWRSRR